MRILAAIMILLWAAAVRADDTETRLSQLEQTNAAIRQHLHGISAVQARTQSDLVDLKEDVKRLTEKVDALVKLSGQKFVPSQQDAWGRGAPATFSAPEASAPISVYTSSQSGYTVRRMGPVRRVAARACAS